MSTIASLNILTKVSTAGLVSGLKKGQQSLQSFGDKVTSVKGMLLGFGAAMGAGFLFNKAKDFVGWGIELAADAETAQVAFETLIGSISKAKTLIADLKKFSAKTPFEFTDVRQASQTLLNFGLTAENVLPMVSRLGDIASGDAEKLKGLSLVYGQISSTGRLMGQDLLQLINAGFNPLMTISQKTGESMADLKKRMEQGGISAQEVTEAIVTATSAGGQFFQMSEKQSQTLAGRWSTLKDNVAQLATTLGEQLMPIAGALVDTFAGWVTSLGSASDAGFDFGQTVSKSLDWVIKGAGILADVVHTIKLAFTGVGVVVIKVFALMMKAITGFVKFHETQINNIIKSLPKWATEKLGLRTVDLSSGLDQFTKSLEQSGKDAGASWMEAFTGKTPSERLDAWYEQVKQASKQAKKEIETVRPELQPQSAAQQFGKWLSGANLKRSAFNFKQSIKDWFSGLGDKGIKREAIEIKQPELIFKGSQEANKALFDWKNLFDGSGPSDTQKDLLTENKTQTSILQDMLLALKDKYIPQPVQDIVMSF